jgi:anti-sigma regulatory factor (Ser/Thr protein kinase)
MKENAKLKIFLPNIPNIEMVAIEGLSHLANYLGITNEKIGEARVLVTEAVINALEHSGKNANVRVDFTIDKKKLVVFVRDYGHGFEPESIEEPVIEKKMGSANKRGWGLKLMKSMSDDLNIESDSNGTKITIIKHLV